MIATISPAITSLEETLSTIKFADRAKNILQRVQKNESSIGDHTSVGYIEPEVSRIREIVINDDDANSTVID